MLSYTEYAKYWEKFRSDPAYAQFARFYKQPISVSVKVIGTEGIDDPNIQPITVTVNVEGGGFSRTFADLTGGTYTCSSSDGRTAADALLSVLAQNRYTYTGTPGYITGVTDANGVALTAGDKTFGPWSGWMFTVNGEMPILRTDASGNITYAALNQYQVKKDDVIRFYYVACPTETGYHTGARPPAPAALSAPCAARPTARRIPTTIPASRRGRGPPTSTECATTAAARRSSPPRPIAGRTARAACAATPAATAAARPPAPRP